MLNPSGKRKTVRKRQGYEGVSREGVCVPFCVAYH